MLPPLDSQTAGTPAGMSFNECLNEAAQHRDVYQEVFRSELMKHQDEDGVKLLVQFQAGATPVAL